MDMMALRRRIMMQSAEEDSNLFDLSSLVSGTLDGYGNLVPNSKRRTTGFITLKPGTYSLSRARYVDWWKCYKYTMNESYFGAFFNNTSLTNTFNVEEEMKIRISFDYIPTVEDNIQLIKTS